MSFEPEGGGVLEFDTVTLRCELELLPAASRATAVTVWRAVRDVSGRGPADRVRRARVLGADVGAVHLELHADDADVVGRGGGDARRAGDGRSCSRAREPDHGGVCVAGGGVLEFDTVTLRCELELLPAASRATAVSECPPFATLAVFQLSE